MDTTPQKALQQIEVIIPIHNLRKRGFERIRNSIYSLNIQKINVNINLCDSSNLDEHNQLIEELKGLKYTMHRIKGLKEFNKPILLNEGVKRTTGNFILCTDADYIFRDDFSECLLNNIQPNRMIIKKVKMLPKNLMTNESRIENWFFPDLPLNPFGEWADGGCQFAHRSWFEHCGGYDERMNGWCGMDNDMTQRFKRNGGDLFWMNESEFLHQWHPIMKGKNKNEIAKTKSNWYIRDNDKTIIRNIK